MVVKWTRSFYNKGKLVKLMFYKGFLNGSEALCILHQFSLHASILGIIMQDFKLL